MPATKTSSDVSIGNGVSLASDLIQRTLTNKAMCNLLGHLAKEGHSVDAEISWEQITSSKINSQTVASSVSPLSNHCFACVFVEETPEVIHMKQDLHDEAVSRYERIASIHVFYLYRSVDST